MKKFLALLVLWPIPGWGQSLRKPDPQLRALIRQWCSEIRIQEDWPQKLMRERQLYLLHGNQAYLWYLSPEGEVFSLDTDRFRQELEPETDLQAALEAVRQASLKRPELKGLLP
ncbi:MAG: hypothetical protein KF760_25260 [Candidatus Eremiobacteraeota bacterium]|nr:hypothetical protein [Candidatus Eremiobacteraeota bacterium]MCW5872116.1 hypothetical protein [Candidatus Eremiobacteraeota bacterium]